MTANPAGPGTDWRAEVAGVQLCALFRFHLLATWTVAASGPSSRSALRCDGLLARSVSPVFAPGLLTGWPDPALLTTSLSLTGACNDNDPTVLQARSSARGARPGRLVWRRRRRHSGSPGGLCPSDSDNWSGWVRGRHGPRPGFLGLVNVPAWRGTRENAEVMTVAFHPYDRVFGRRDG